MKIKIFDKVVVINENASIKNVVNDFDTNIKRMAAYVDMAVKQLYGNSCRWVMCGNWDIGYIDDGRGNLIFHTTQVDYEEV